LREKEKAEKAAEKASRAAACRTQQRLQKALKATQKGNRKRPKAAAKLAQKKTFSVEPQGSMKALGAAAGAPPIRSQHGRKINTPSRYQ
jgi:hypothetical protein